MEGRTVKPEASYHSGPYSDAAYAQRRLVLRETIAAYSEFAPRYRNQAAANLSRWKRLAEPSNQTAVRVLRGDWGEVTGQLTREYGSVFAALNMANAYVPGGGYVEGCPAQEENMFRRTDCHFTLDESSLSSCRERYLPEMTSLLNAERGRVYLDTKAHRVCIRGPENRARTDLGYPWLEDDELFPFYELRAAAMDLRHGESFSEEQTFWRIEAQLETLSENGVRHAVLSAFGCGAFRNPADRVAALYRRAIEQRREDFDCIAFAIFHPGYGPDNYTPFLHAFP
jgi:hypothetical protein